MRGRIISSGNWGGVVKEVFSCPSDTNVVGCSNIQEASFNKDGDIKLSVDDAVILLTAGMEMSMKAGEEVRMIGPGGYVDIGPAGVSIQSTVVVINGPIVGPGGLDILSDATIVGNLNVTGTLTKGGGSFKIDDPLDAANKTLSHSFVESPDMMNIYNGNVTTDKHGLATVTLPAYFEALNRDFRYQLTVIGQFAQAIVGKEISQNRFIIRTDKPGVKVSWQVTGIRQDAWANAHRIPVEEQKPQKERGYCGEHASGRRTSSAPA